MINRISDFRQDTKNGQAATDFLTTMGRAITDRLQGVKLETLAKENPTVLLGVGLAVGVALGWWVKRK